MKASITNFQISRLHGHIDVSIDIEDNCTILVGVNGLGKTTVISMLYYFLTRQWLRLLDYKFEFVAATIEGQRKVLSRAKVAGSFGNKALWRRLEHRIPLSAITKLKENPQAIASIASSRTGASIAEISKLLGISPNIAAYVRAYISEIAGEDIQQELFEDQFNETNEISKYIEVEVQDQVLYLPTYRRIERDLEKLIPGLEEGIQKHRRERITHAKAHVEFVEFGMQDVEQFLEERFSKLKEMARIELNNLAASYLSEVIRGEAGTYDESLIRSLDDVTTAKILGRVEERDILNAPDKVTLKEVIERLKNPEISPPEVRDRYIGHFFSKLAAIHRSLAREEETVEAFVNICNSYLENKKIEFDDKQYKISIRQSNRNGDAEIKMHQLSSGEKQIVSLFAHIYLRESPNLIIIIDEPELSLSVTWQRRLLPDIRDSGRCSFLAAATHSPFVFENIAHFATDLGQCLSRKQ